MQYTLFHSIIVNKRCNLACDYCDATSHKFISHLDGIEDKGAVFRKTVERFQELFSAKVLEMIGGGEIFTEKGVCSWVEPVAQYYDHIEIVSNGLYLPLQDVKEVAVLGSFSLAVSLDGHTFDMCRSRFASKNQFDAVMENVRNVLESGIYLELRTVLNKNNVYKMQEFLEFLLPYKDCVALQISPVKDKVPNSTARQDFNEAYLDCVNSILYDHWKYKDFIAPLEYFRAMKEYFEYRKKPVQCFIPYFKLLTLIEGKQAACSVNWIKEMPGLFDIDGDQDYFDQDIFRLMCRKQPVLSTCIHDFGDSDIYNLYMLDRIGLEDLSYFVLYTRPAVKERMKRLKEQYGKVGAGQ